LIVPAQCLPLLKEHRTHYKGDFVAAYNADLESTYQSIKNHLPADGVILDIGCGMGGIDVLLSQHYRGRADITLLDKQGVSPEINSGFHLDAGQFSHYCRFDDAMALLGANGVTAKTVDIGREPFPDGPFSIVISLLSWGFHYPIDTYSPNVASGGIIVADVRHGTGGIKALEQYGPSIVVHTAQKFNRVVIKC